MKIIEYLDYVEKIENKEIIKMLEEIEKVIGCYDITMLAWYYDSGMKCGFEKYIELFYNNKLTFDE